MQHNAFSGWVLSGPTKEPTAITYSSIKKEVHTPCLEKRSTYFCRNFVKILPTLIIFGIQMAKTIELCKVHSFSTSHLLAKNYQS